MCDIALDNFVYGAHTTASDLLWQGIPIVSISGTFTRFALFLLLALMFVVL